MFEQHQAPDAALAQVREGLEREGFTVGTGARFDVSARRGVERVLVGVAPHEEGLVARVNCKAAGPGRAERLHQRVADLLSERLGSPRREGA